MSKQKSKGKVKKKLKVRPAYTFRAKPLEDRMKSLRSIFEQIVDAYDLVEVKSGRGCLGCPNQINGRNLGYCNQHSTSGRVYLLSYNERKAVEYSPVNESLNRGSLLEGK